MVDKIVADTLGALVLVTTIVAAIYGNSLRSAISGSELAKVWKFINLGVVFLFLGALTSVSSAALNIEPHVYTMAFVFLASLSLAYGIKLQRDKVR